MATAEVLQADCVEHATVSAQRFYRPELDALRFCAFLAVYICHSIPNGVVDEASHPGSGIWLHLLAAVKDAGNFGVCLFFILSAFLITELLRREQSAYGRIHVRAFYLRRMLRIWPLYFGITIVYALAGRWFHAMRMEPGRVLAYFLLAGNWYIALHPWIQTPLRSLWSISVEEQFYLTWPLLARYGGRRLLAQASLVIILISLLAIIIASADKAFAYNTVWLNSFVQFQFFAWGALSALVLSGDIPIIHRVSRCTAGLTGILLWLLSAWATGIKRPGTHTSAVEFCFGYVAVAAGCLLILLAALGTDKRRIPGWAVYLGKISFGLYVFHETAFLLVDEVQKHVGVPAPRHRDTALALISNKVVALGVTILLAMLSYRFWESPFLRLKRRVTWIRSRGV